MIFLILNNPSQHSVNTIILDGIHMHSILPDCILSAFQLHLKQLIKMFGPFLCAVKHNTLLVPVTGNKQMAARILLINHLIHKGQYPCIKPIVFKFCFILICRSIA